MMFRQFLTQDTRFALRLLRKSPASTAAGILMLAIGIGINSAIFSFVQGLLFRPLLLPDMESLISIWSQNPRQRKGKSDISPADFNDFKEQCRSFSHLAAYEWWETVLQEKGEAEPLQGMRVTEDFFTTLKVPPAFGRCLGAEDRRNGPHDVAVLGYRLWQRRFGGREDLIGKTLVLDGKACSIIGIMPAAFEFPITAELWVPIDLAGERGLERSKRFLQVIGRLQPATPEERARAEIRAVSDRLAASYPASNEGWQADLSLLRERIVSDSGTTNPLLILSFATGLVAAGLRQRRQSAAGRGNRTAKGDGHSVRVGGQHLAAHQPNASREFAAGLGRRPVERALRVPLHPRHQSHAPNRPAAKPSSNLLRSLWLMSRQVLAPNADRMAISFRRPLSAANSRR